MSERYLTPTLSIDERVSDLLERMTLPEKVGQMLQLNAQDDLEEIVLTRYAGSILHASPDSMARAHELVAQTRLRIPLLIADDCIHGHSFWRGATILPTQLGMACSFNPDLVREGARMTAVEVAATGIHWTFSPVLCIARDLRWGRVNETFGEDPYLLGVMGTAMVEGYQGSGLDDRTGILACAKHFAGYSETIGGRDASEADISRRKLRSWFLPPFEAVARAGCRSFMLGYESIDGVPITANSWLLNDVLRGEWGFTGTLVTDWDNVGSLVRDQKVARDITEAAAIAVKCGNDLIMTTPSFFEGAQEAVENGLISEADVDEAVKRILAVKFQMGLFEDPRLPDVERQKVVIGSEEHRTVALEQARAGLVLLTNDGLLPLDTEKPTRLALVGANADDVNAQLGDWAGASGQVQWLLDGHPRELTETIRDGLLAVLPATWEMEYQRGGGIGASHGVPHLGPDGQPVFPVFEPEPPVEKDLAAAVEAARVADVTVVVVGDNVFLNGETKSTATLDLQGSQVELLKRIAALGKPYVVVVLSGKPLILPESIMSADAVIQAFNPGMRGGRAVAELLLGLIEPVGRLPLGIPRHVGQQPVFYNVVRGQHGRRYADLTQDPQFVFGEGLAYTTFVYSDLEVASPITADGEVQAQVTVTNTGSRTGTETVQVYISDLVTSVTWAGKELKAFTQATLEPGQAERVRIAFPASRCSIVTADERRIVEPGEFDLLVGHSSRQSDLQVGRFEITE